MHLNPQDKARAALAYLIIILLALIVLLTEKLKARSIRRDPAGRFGGRGRLLLKASRRLLLTLLIGTLILLWLWLDNPPPQERPPA